MCWAFCKICLGLWSFMCRGSISITVVWFYQNALLKYRLRYNPTSTLNLGHETKCKYVLASFNIRSNDHKIRSITSVNFKLILNTLSKILNFILLSLQSWFVTFFHSELLTQSTMKRTSYILVGVMNRLIEENQNQRSQITV